VLEYISGSERESLQMELKQMRALIRTMTRCECELTVYLLYSAMCETTQTTHTHDYRDVCMCVWAHRGEICGKSDSTYQIKREKHRKSQAGEREVVAERAA
jgi:hypothetical protein